MCLLLLLFFLFSLLSRQNTACENISVMVLNLITLIVLRMQEFGDDYFL